MTIKHILIADDEKHTRLALSLLLKNAGFQVETACDGVEAFNTIIECMNNQSPIDLLITDYRMPKLSGMELIQMLNQGSLSIPVVFITGYGNNELVQELRTKGNIHYLDKPFRVEKLLQMIQQSFEQEECQSVSQAV
ncbi:response regulator [Thermodesulfobacteriota bacterium]